MSLADLAYLQQILDETFDDIWTSAGEYQFELVCDIPAWALEAWAWPREHAEESEHDADESGDEPLQIDQYGCRFSVGPVLLSYKGELEWPTSSSTGRAHGGDHPVQTLGRR